MADSVLITGALAAGASASGTLALTAPVNGVDIVLSTQFAAASAHPVYLTYQVSIDGGTTYSDPVATHVSTPSTDATTHTVQASLTNLLQNATNIKFTLLNRDPKTALTSAILQAIQF